MRVVDASVLLDIFVEPSAHETEIAALQAESALYAPHVMDLEVINGLRKMLLSDRMDLEQAAHAIAALKDLPITRVDVTEVIDNIWSLRDNFTAYDAAYVALAAQLDVPLMTRDERLASHARRFVQIV